jgi:hypothetical protein
VRVGEGARDVLEDGHGLADRERSALESGAQRLALDERHDEVRQWRRRRHGGVGRYFARREHRHDVRVLKRRREHDLAFEPIDRDGRGQLIRQDLHDDGAPERVVAGDENGRHAAAPELPLEGVGAA